MSKKKKVLISGAGPSGLATALLLDRNIYDVHVVERSSDFNTLGFSLILWKTGFEIVKRILQEEPESTSPLNTIKILAGEKLHEVHTVDIRGLAYSVGRTQLMQAMSRKFLDDLGQKAISFSTHIVDAETRDDKEVVVLSNGKTEEYDLVICADGMHSAIRNKHFKTKLTSAAYRIVYQWIEPGSGLYQESLVGFMKDVMYLIQTFEDKALLAYYIESDDVGPIFEEKITRGFNSRDSGEFKINADSRHIFAGEHVEVENWYEGSLVLIGDAAHGHPPTFALGTSMALEDVECLSRLLNSTMPIPVALKQYSDQRRERVKSVYAEQRLTEKVFLSHSMLKIKLTEFAFMAGSGFLLDKELKKIDDHQF